MRPAATCAANTQTDDRWLQLLTNKPAAGPAPPVSLPGAHLLNRASRCSRRLCSALWASTTEDSKRTALLVSIVDPLQSVTAPNESPLTAKRNIRTRTALISSSSCGQKQTVDMLTRQEEATLRVKRLHLFYSWTLLQSLCNRWASYPGPSWVLFYKLLLAPPTWSQNSSDWLPLVHRRAEQ